MTATTKRWKLPATIAAIVIATCAGTSVAWALATTPPTPPDTYYSCVSSAGVVRAGTIRLNTPKSSCPNATDSMRSWAAQEATGTLFNRMTMTATSQGCAPGEYRVAVNQMGTTLSWSETGCHPIASRPEGGIYLETSANTAALPARFVTNASIGADLPAGAVIIAGVQYTLTCNADLGAGQARPVGSSPITVGCDLPNGQLGSEPDAATARARFITALATGITSPPFIIYTQN